MDWGWLGNIGNTLGNLFGGGHGNSWMSGNANQQAGSGFNVGTGQGYGSYGGGNQGGIGSLFGNAGKPNFMGGLAGLFGSQLVGNPKTPKLPANFGNLQNMAQAGGPPIQQQSNQYLQSLLSGQNTSANDAATRSLDLQHEEELRQLQGQYKSLRPGSDPLTDSTWLRDKALLDQKYSQNRADTLARQQMMAAQQGGQLGNQMFEQQATLLQPELEKQMLDWEAQLQKRTQLRNSLMGLFGNQATGGMYGLGSLFSRMFGGQ